MSHEYDVHLSDGSSYNVKTPNHHDDHDTNTFASHLLDIIKSIVGNVASGVLVHRFTYKGRAK